METWDQRSVPSAHLQSFSCLLSLLPFHVPLLCSPFCLPVQLSLLCSLLPTSCLAAPSSLKHLQVGIYFHQNSCSRGVRAQLFPSDALKTEGCFRHTLLSNSIIGQLRFLFIAVMLIVKSTKSEKEKKGSKMCVLRCSLNTFAHVLGKCYFQNLSEQY